MVSPTSFRNGRGNKGVGSRNDTTSLRLPTPFASRLSPDELATGRRLEAQLGRPLKESPHVGAEFVDDLGRSYDALGTSKASQFWNEKQFVNSIDGHLLKSNNFTVIDLTGFTQAQIAAVKNHLATLTPEQLARIITIVP